jgi:hypothetical protein
VALVKIMAFLQELKFTSTSPTLDSGQLERRAEDQNDLTNLVDLLATKLLCNKIVGAGTAGVALDGGTSIAATFLRERRGQEKLESASR